MVAPQGRVVAAVAPCNTLVSFIIPVLDEAAGIVGLLLQLRASFSQAQIIVVDGGSSDNSQDLARPHCDILLEAGKGRARQMNAGAGVADGQYLFFLHADTFPQFEQQGLHKLLSEKPLWGFCPVRLSEQNFVLAMVQAGINLRSRVSGIGTGDQLLFVQRQLFCSSGGFEDIPLMEDVAFSKTMRRLQRPCILPFSVCTSSRRWHDKGIVRTVLLMWGLRMAYALGVSPHRLWWYYYGRR